MSLNIKPVIAVVGCFQNGKSTLINCLLDDNVAQVGWGDATTHISSRYVYGEMQSAMLYPKEREQMPQEMHLRQFLEKIKTADPDAHERAEIKLWKPILRQFDIIDTPGFNANAEDEERAIQSISEADYLIFLISNEKGMSESERHLLSMITDQKIPCVMVLNCISFDRWSPLSPENIDLQNQIYAMLQRYHMTPESIDGKTPVWSCNLLWFWYASGRSSELYEKWKKTGRLIQNYFDLEGESSPAPTQLAEKSCFLPVRHYFQNRSWHDLNMDKTLSSVKQAVLKQHVIDSRGVEIIRDILYESKEPGNIVISRAEADFLFDLYNATFDKANDPGWKDIFINAISRHVLENGQFPIEINRSDAEWIIGRIEIKGKINDTGITLLRYLRKKARTIPNKLRFKMEFWGI